MVFTPVHLRVARSETRLKIEDNTKSDTSGVASRPVSRERYVKPEDIQRHISVLRALRNFETPSIKDIIESVLASIPV